MTTALSVLQSGLGTLIGDSNDEYSSNYTNAINNASKEIPDVLFIVLDNMDLITGNILPPFNWATSSTLDFYTEPTGTLAKNTDGTYIWNGSSSASVLASGSNDKLYLSSNDYPRLLDIMNKSVDFKCWVYPVDSAADAFLKIKTWQADGTAQELDSTTTTYAGKKNLIEMESQSINDDLSLIEIWLRVATTAQTVYFDMPRLTGTTIREYLLPKDFQDGHLSRVEVQTWGDVDDLHSPNWQPVYDWSIIPDGADKYLRLPASYGSERRIRLKGYKALEQLSDSSDTISIDAERVNLLLSYAAFKLFEMESQEIQYTIDNYTTDITAIDTEIDTPIASIDTAKTNIATFTSSIATVDTEIATEDTAITGVATDIATQVTNIATAVTALDAITAAIATATTAVDGVASDIATLQGVIDTAVTNVATIASEDISRFEAAIARNQGQITRDIARRDALIVKRDNLMVKRSAKDDDVRRIDDIKKRLEDKRDALQDKRARLLVEKDGLVGDIKRMDDLRQRLADEIARFEAERIRIHQKRNESKSVMARLKERSLEWLGKYNVLLPSLKMTPPQVTMKVGW